MATTSGDIRSAEKESSAEDIKESSAEDIVIEGIVWVIVPLIVMVAGGRESFVRGVWRRARVQYFEKQNKETDNNWDEDGQRLKWPFEVKCQLTIPERAKPTLSMGLEGPLVVRGPIPGTPW
jgi:hypothetical protein